ncbi:MAG: preprotein translocase subunit YajC [Lachnospiraceae bacterium]|nr:preprotein translocase subunit YajC [Lachnospiraceae bacterium]
MNLLPFLTEGAAAATPTNAGGMGLTTMIIYIVVIGAVFYFMLIRPQKKQQKQMDALVSSLEIGDSVLTTAGFYGVIIDIMDEVIVVEFGNNKNCRIPMKKTAIVEVEKPESAEA